MPTRIRIGSTQSLFERLIYLAPAQAQSRQDSRGYTGDHGNDGSEKENLPVEADVDRARQFVGKKSDNQSNLKMSIGEAERPSREREEHRLSEDLAQHAGRSCAQCGSNRDLFLAAEGFRQCQVGYVDASNEKNESDGSQKNQKCRPHVTHKIVVQGHDDGPPTFVILRIT